MNVGDAQPKHVIPIGGGPAATPVFEPSHYDELTPALQAALQPRVERLGYLGAFFAFAGSQPRALAAFIDFTESLREDLPEPLVEIVAISISSEYRNEYEHTQHVRLARKHGHSDEWIAGIHRAGDPAVLSSSERAVRDLALAMTQRAGHGVRSELEQVHRLLGREVSVGVLLLAARYIGHSHVANAMELTAPEQVNS